MNLKASIGNYTITKFINLANNCITSQVYKTNYPGRIFTAEVFMLNHMMDLNTLINTIFSSNKQIEEIFWMTK